MAAKPPMRASQTFGLSSVGPPGTMASQEEASAWRRFFQYVEDRCLQAYDNLVIQNASDISRESDRLRNDANWTYLQEKKQKKKRQGEAIKRTDDEAAGATDVAFCGKHFRMGFMTVPPPQDRLPPPGQAFGIRSQSLTSVGADAADERKQPPPKPKRDPNTKLSGSSEALHTQSQDQDEGHLHACGEDSKKTPPPKPKRNPNTQLSSSFDEAHPCHHGDRGTDTPSPQSGFSASRDDPESVYIEMAANVPVKSPDDQNESVYEEMKYSDSCLSLYRIPQPFPNLLTHRPPLLVFPPFPPQRSPNSDESPLTPVDVTQLSMPGRKAGKRSEDEDERPSASTVAASGRSSAPPLASGSARDGSVYPRSRSACPSPVGAGRSRTPVGLKRPPPPYNASLAGRPPEGGASPDDCRSGNSAEELKCPRQLGRSSSTSGVPSMPSTPQDHPALSQMPWLCGDATMMETIQKKRVLCHEIKSRRRAQKNLGERDHPPVAPNRRRKQPPPYSSPPAASAGSAPAVWDTAI
ncbi:neuronal tyrosine-phosphorylated phosphoinositide-3-kinase adapter 2-like isoform X2 [Syngnathoides biaculeatus]|uniref:neuronal tyrosine-phosphorylated phosphoinositide-3-kinase adapter 2-like isoform X2 n=1 Tax=Syngnathoides biaculeatus TaxID=300417 RepID=UPI002ADDA085|nr:neuronal tyrosine-phosphorylated phosphoinositide-3-kinase adapter 2-like isoform X2 [Syngnathoides biaculeatus]XP_061682919.1 neuronal tyrosine-phosphorylated phosphoinositide-3-kinase adapter 2-like isoform X2 [Syngnathoides biaculeatus]